MDLRRLSSPTRPPRACRRIRSASFPRKRTNRPGCWSGGWGAFAPGGPWSGRKGGGGEAYRRWLTMVEPKWARVDYPKIDYQDLYYYSAPKPKKTIGSLDEVDPEILKTYEKLGIPLREVEGLEGVVGQDGRKGLGGRGIAVDAVFDSVSVATTFQKELKQAGVIFMPI